ncbi:MAG: restriction endonuclease subunit S [Sterolibacterium sp.]
MNEWTEESLGRLASIEIGGTPSRDIPAFWASENAEGFPWVSIADLGPRFVSATKERITELGVLSSNVKPVRSGTLMMSFKLTIGRAGIAARDLYTNEAIAAFVPMPRTVDSGFLYYLLPPISRNAVTDVAIKGSTLNKQTLSKLKLRFPKDMQQQCRIAEILSTLDEAIEQTEALIAKQRQIKAGLMHDLFTRGVTPDGHLRPTRESQSTRFGWIPKAWRIGSLLDVADLARQPILTGPFGADLGSDDFVADGVPVLRIGNVQQGQLDVTDLLYVTEAKARGLKRYSVKEGDLLFARQGATTGRNALASREADGWLINYHIIRVALDHSRCAPIFIEAAFAGEIVIRQVERDKGRGTREGINTAQLKALQIPLASVSEQNTIAQILMTHESQCAEMQRYLAKLRQQKHGLMHDLLTGRVRVPEGAQNTDVSQ